MNSRLRIETLRYQDQTAEIKEIRTQVFQYEQGISADLEFDGLDADAVHLLAYLNKNAVATARIRAIANNCAKIERLAVLSKYRHQGIGTQLMQSALSAIAKQGKRSAVVHAQTYIASLYTSLGFELVGEEFSEAGINHVKMIKQL
ncbi:MAG: GNAT family N-acetyltransferase [Cyanobacteria bacterium J06600_6]